MPSSEPGLGVEKSKFLKSEWGVAVEKTETLQSESGVGVGKTKTRKRGSRSLEKLERRRIKPKGLNTGKTCNKSYVPFKKRLQVII